MIERFNQIGKSFPFEALAPEKNAHANENFYGAWNAKERDFILFPRIPSMTVNREKTHVGSAFLDGGMIVFTTNGDRSGVHAFYYFDDKLKKLRRYRPSDPMLGYHRQLYNEGILSADATADEIKKWARCKRFPTAPDGEDPTEVAISIHTGQAGVSQTTQR